MKPHPYTEEQKRYILSKVKGIKWESISVTLKDFWVEHQNKENGFKDSKDSKGILA